MVVDVLPLQCRVCLHHCRAVYRSFFPRASDGGRIAGTKLPHLARLTWVWLQNHIIQNFLLWHFRGAANHIRADLSL